MNEVLDLVRRENNPAYSYFNEELSTYVAVAPEVVNEQFERFKTIHAGIFSEQLEIKSRFVLIGAYLYELRRDEIYRIVAVGTHGTTGYSNFYNFCSDVFGFKKTTVVNLLKVFEEFCSKESGLLNVEYINYSYSQLVSLSRMDKYRERIPVTMSCRDIDKLKDYYKHNTPKAGVSVEEDLRKCKEQLKEEKRRKDEAKNKINFVPAKKPDIIEYKSDDLDQGFDGQTSDHLSEEITSSEDERDLSTPDVRKDVSFEDIRAGLLRQLELLRKVSGWQNAVWVFEEALNDKNPSNVVSRSFYLKEVERADRLAEQLFKVKSSDTYIVGSPAIGKLELKNVKVRKEWLDKYKDWGVWLEVPELDLKYYRYNFENGNSLIVEVGKSFHDAWIDRKIIFTDYEHVRYAIIDDRHTAYDCVGISYSMIIDWLTKHAKEI